MTEIPIGRGSVALIDDVDASRVLAHHWSLHPPSGRNRRSYAMCKLRGTTVYLHRFVLDAPQGIEVDHVNGDGLDCRRANLRLATRSQNEANKTKAESGSVVHGSRFKGVWFAKKNGKWRAGLMVNQRHVHVGYFSDEAEAARAYDAAALATWGAFALLNFPSER